MGAELIAFELTPDEAQALLDVLGRVGGDPNSTMRGFTQSVYSRLRELGFKSQFRWETPEVDGHITFKSQNDLRLHTCKYNGCYQRDAECPFHGTSERK